MSVSALPVAARRHGAPVSCISSQVERRVGFRLKAFKKAAPPASPYASTYTSEGWVDREGLYGARSVCMPVLDFHFPSDCVGSVTNTAFDSRRLADCNTRLSVKPSLESTA